MGNAKTYHTKNLNVTLKLFLKRYDHSNLNIKHMIDLLLGILGTILELVLSFIAPLMIMTGEIVLAILSLGYHRPRLSRDVYKEYTSELPNKSLSF